MRSSSFKVRLSIQDRDLERFPTDDDALGSSFSALFSDALRKGPPPPALFTVFSDRVEIMDLRAVLENREPMKPFIAAATHREGVEVVALLGVLDQVRGGRTVARAGSVFLEWPDCRWWHAVQVLGPDGVPLQESPEIARAVDGLPRPQGLGGWFSMGRFFRMSLRLEPSEPSSPEPLVH